MEVIDEQGRVFGVVNIIDLLVVVFVLAVIAAGSALVLGDTQQDTETVTITVQADNVQPYVADAVPAPGSVDRENVTSIKNKTVQPAPVLTTNDSGAVFVRDHPRLKTVELEVTVQATRTSDGLSFDGQQLKIGRTVTLDLARTDIRGNVTSVETEE